MAKIMPISRHHHQPLLPMLVSVLAMVSCIVASETPINDELSELHIVTSVFVDNQAIHIPATPNDDLHRIGAEFCAEYGIDVGLSLRDGRPRCATLIADELADGMYCNASFRARWAQAANRAGRLRPDRAFRFYHGMYYFDSEEYELLRILLLRLGMVECLSGERMGGGESVIWLLGHLEETAPFYTNLYPHQASNAIPRPTELGDKDHLYAHLDRLRLHIGDRAIRFVPRTWLPGALDHERARQARSNSSDEIGGIWLRKDPQIELGGGIKLARRWSELGGCAQCILQRYVERPMLLNDPTAGIVDAKFSVGVYLSVSTVAPLTAWLHREMLVLLCNHAYQDPHAPIDKQQRMETNRSDPENIDILAHLTNGLLNQRLAAENYNAAERVWTTDRLLTHIERSGLSWRYIEDQFREIAALVLIAVRQTMLEAVTKSGSEAKGTRLFSHWRLDFLLDEDGRAWLLEVEIVPSTGTIGGVDEVLKSAVLRDVLALAGAGSPSTSSIAYRDHFPWLRGSGCWIDGESRGQPPNRVCAKGDPDESLYGQDAEIASAQAAERILAHAGDPLRYDATALEVIGKYEASRLRAGGYRPLFPLPRNFEYFDGQDGGSMAEPGLLALWNKVGAIAADVVLDRWECVRAEFMRSAHDDNDIFEERASESVTAQPWQGGLDLPSMRRACQACVSQESFSYCATLDRFDADGHVRIKGRCQRDIAECLHAPPGLVDGVLLANRDACALDNNFHLEAHLLDASRAGTLYEHAGGFQMWCGRQLRRAMRAGFDDKKLLLRICDSGEPRAAAATPVPISVPVIDGCDSTLDVTKVIQEAFFRNTPLIVRRIACASNDANAGHWMPANLAASDVAAATIVAMAYDQEDDAAQPIYSAALTFREFLSLTTGEPHLISAKEQLPYGMNTSLYLLLTDRHKIDGIVEGGLANPNSATMRDESAVAKLHAKAVALMDTALTVVAQKWAFETAWTSLRFGSHYKYPTHVDCFENVILQLEGAKNVTYFTPETIHDLRPDVRTKHWPRGDASALQRATQTAMTVEIQPGDLAYVPLMWPHNVAASGWSVTSNRYFWLRDHSVWEGYLDDKKRNGWLSYEIMEGERVC